MTKPIKLGMDLGASQATIAIPYRRAFRTLTIPSWTGSGNERELKRLRAGGGRKIGQAADVRLVDESEPIPVAAFMIEEDEEARLKLRELEAVLIYRGVEEFVGHLALEQSSDATAARGDHTRYWSGHTLKLALTLLGLAYPKRIPPVYLTTGLPVHLWSEEVDELVRRCFVGEHPFILNGVERHAEILGVMTMMEGAGCLAYRGSDRRVPQAVADGGGQTFDLFYAIGQEPQIDRCKAKPIGVELIGQIAAAEILRKYDRQLSAREVRDLLWSYARGTQPDPLFAQVNGKRIELPINGTLEEADDAVGLQAQTFIAQTWGGGSTRAVANEVIQLWLIGGIAHFPITRQHITNLVGLAEVPDHPEEENAVGYAATGQTLTDADWAEMG